MASVSRRRPASEGLFVPGTETAAVFIRWTGWWVAESRMPLHIGRQAFGDVAPRGLGSVVIALLRDRAERRKRRWHGIHDKLRVRTPGQHEWEQQCGEYCNLSHIHLQPHRMDWMSRPCRGATLY
jgi:hypothetical protein